MRKGRILYAMIFLLFIVQGLLPVMILFGLNWFTNESIYIIYLGGEANMKLSYIIIKIILIALTIVLILLTNKLIRKQTLQMDSELEDNPTIPKYYERFKIDYIGCGALAIDLMLALLSYFSVGANANKYLIFIVIAGFLELVVGIVVLYNKVKYQEFFEETERKNN